MQKRRALVTGGAGFIGSHLCEQLLASNFSITVLDNFDPFYDKSIKINNLQNFVSHPNCHFIELDIRDYDKLIEKCTDDYDLIIHLAAKAGVRPSIENPFDYQTVNVNGTQNLLEFAKNKNIKQFIFASSSSVYGINPNVPWKESDHVLNPISPYASTKISGELLGHVYSNLYGIRFIALRFFTVYGPRQRPDLAIHLFANRIQNNLPIKKFGNGETFRDYTFVSDIVDGILGAIQYDKSLFEVFNLGNHHTVSLNTLIDTLEKALDKKANIEFHDQQPGDVPETFADVSKSKELLGYTPKINFQQGIDLFTKWLIAKDSNHL